MKNILCFVSFCWLASLCLHASAEELPFLQTKVKSLVAFKDGTVFIVKEGTVNVGKSGKVITRPITDAAFGTVGASCSTEGVRVKMLTASAAPSTAARLDFCNSAALAHGRPITVKRRDQETELRGELLGLRAPTALAQAVGLPSVTQPDDHVLSIKQTNGLISLVPLTQVESCTFGDARMAERDPEKTGQHLKIALAGYEEGQEVTIAYYYLWKGVQWTPTYLLERDEKGTLRVDLRGEVINHLLDFEDAKLHLVVGVPNFAFHKIPSPMVAQKSLTQVTPALQKAAPVFYNGFSQTQFTNIAVGNNLAAPANAPPIEQPQPENPENPLGAASARLPDVSSTDAGNLHLFEVETVELKKGERAIINLATMELNCQDLVTWDIADTRVETAAKEVTPADRAANPLIHYWKIQAEETPLTTGAALVMKGDIALSQDKIYYTPRGTFGRFRVGNAIGMTGMAEETVLSRTPGEKEIEDRQDSYQGKAFWLMKKHRWTDEVRELTVTVQNNQAFPAEMQVTRTFSGIPKDMSEGVTMRTLGTRSESKEQTSRLSWKGPLAPGEAHTLTIKYEIRTF